ncbi:MAG: hypothetical protein JWM58_4028 [Rhizobium sp.]|nr:hypothetical protein [Rhizobium sp.]
MTGAGSAFPSLPLYDDSMYELRTNYATDCPDAQLSN